MKEELKNFKDIEVLVTKIKMDADKFNNLPNQNIKKEKDDCKMEDFCEPSSPSSG